MSTQPVAVCDTWRADRGGVEGMGNLPSASPIERPAQNHDVDSVLRDLLHRDSLDTQPVVEHSDGHPEPKRPKLSDSAGVSTGLKSSAPVDRNGNSNGGTLLSCLVADLGDYLKTQLSIDHMVELARLESTNGLDSLFRSLPAGPGTNSGGAAGEPSQSTGKRRRGRKPSDSSYKTTLLKGLEDCIVQCKQTLAMVESRPLPGDAMPLNVPQPPPLLGGTAPQPSQQVQEDTTQQPLVAAGADPHHNLPSMPGMHPGAARGPSPSHDTVPGVIQPLMLQPHLLQQLLMHAAVQQQQQQQLAQLQLLAAMASAPGAALGPEVQLQALQAMLVGAAPQAPQLFAPQLASFVASATPAMPPPPAVSLPEVKNVLMAPHTNIPHELLSALLNKTNPSEHNKQ